MNELRHQPEHPVAGRWSPASWSRCRTCRSASRCCGAASCSSTWRSPRWRRSASSPPQTAGLELHGWMTQVAAVAAALLGALLLTWTERKRPEVQEALIGVLFVLASTAQILLLANDPHGGEQLKDLLAGQILWVSTEQLVRAAILTAIFAGRVVPLARAPRPRRLLRAVRGDGDDVGAARGRVPGVHDADRARGGDLPPRGQPAARARLLRSRSRATWSASRCRS